MNIKIVSIIFALLMLVAGKASAQYSYSLRDPERPQYAMSRADYSGRVSGESVSLSGEITLEVLSERPTNIKFFPASVTLRGVLLDGTAVPVIVQEGYFVVPVSSRGAHKLLVDFEVGVQRSESNPEVSLVLPKVPVSRLELTLPGKKELTLSPRGEVQHTHDGNQTKATVFLPMSESFKLSWNEAVPKEAAEFRTNLALYELLSLEEGSLSAKILADFEIIRGQTNSVEFELPANLSINQVSSATDTVSDWRLIKGSNGKDKLEVYFARAASANFRLQILADRVLPNQQLQEPFELPFLHSSTAQRERGMVALISTKSYALKPVKEEFLTKIGDNQLPVWVKESIELPITHTFKFNEGHPSLAVQAVTPEKQTARFNVETQTLYSLSDVGLRATATAELTVKTGTLSNLTLRLPKEVHVLSVNAPSLASFKIENDTQQLVKLEFTQEMEGQFRVETAYEQLLSEDQLLAELPSISVEGAEIEQGKLAVESLSSAEVATEAANNLTSIEPTELPQQPILKTSNPILLAYRYVRVDPAPALSIKITRHKQLELTGAHIEHAAYHTFITNDGIAITAAEFKVLNTREQFLKFTLPPKAKIWGASVNGVAEKPALDEKQQKLLLKILNSPQGFPVNVIYQTELPRLNYFGNINLELLSPEMVITKVRWELALPHGVMLGRFGTNMQLIDVGVSGNHIAEVFKALPQAGFELSIPKDVSTFALEKHYLNQELPFVEVAYVASTLRILLYLALLVIGGLFGASMHGLVVGKRGAQNFVALTLVSCAAVVFVGYYGFPFWPALFSIPIVPISHYIPARLNYLGSSHSSELARASHLQD